MCGLFQLCVFVSLLWGLNATNGNGDQERIVGGVEVKPKFKYPFIARLWWQNSSLGKEGTLCGGTILNRNWVLTAAHCVRGVAIGVTTITIGDHSVHESEVNEQDLSVKEVILHERYRSVRHSEYIYFEMININQGSKRRDLSQDPSTNWDIAVLRVEPSIRFSTLVAPINLPGCKTEPLYPETTVIGWGMSGTRVTPALREAKTLLVPVDECKKAREQQLNVTILPMHQICTRNVDGMRADHGDSGGPIFQLLEKDKVHSGYVQLGIVSSEAGNGNTHVLYTDVSHFVGWIHRRISGCGNHPFNNLYFSNGTIGIPTFVPKGPKKNLQHEVTWSRYPFNSRSDVTLPVGERPRTQLAFPQFASDQP